MKRYTIASGLAVLSLAWGLGACDRGLTDLNENPNGPTDVSAGFVFPQAVQTSVETVFGRGLNMDIGSTWSQHFAMIQYPDEDRYKLRPQDLDGLWTTFYAGALKDLQTVVEKAEAANEPNEQAAGMILRAWVFGVMTDLWGDIPYSEALMADKDGASSPAYDPQSEIYPKLLADLEQASEMIDTDGDAFGSRDLIYGGDAAKWQRFANSLRLRLAMRLSEVDPVMAQAEFEAAVQAGVFTSNDDNAQLVYAGSPPNEHPFFEDRYRSVRYDHATSKTLVDQLNAWSDPRLPIYAQPTPADENTYAGWQNGTLAAPDQNAISDIGAYWRKTPSAPQVIMSYAEVLFLQAEAAQRGWAANGSAQSLYEDAISASMEQYGITGLPVTLYLAQPGVAWGTDNANKQIAVQKWIALYTNGIEAWTEWRRTGYPALVAGPDAENNGQIPRRLPYPGMEQNLNGANLKEAVARQFGGQDDLNGRIWWYKE